MNSHQSFLSSPSSSSSFPSQHFITRFPTRFFVVLSYLLPCNFQYQHQSQINNPLSSSSRSNFLNLQQSCRPSPLSSLLQLSSLRSPGLLSRLAIPVVAHHLPVVAKLLSLSQPVLPLQQHARTSAMPTALASLSCSVLLMALPNACSTLSRLHLCPNSPALPS